MTFFEICLDKISYDTPYLQVCTEKKKCLKIFFFLEKSPVQPLVKYVMKQLTKYGHIAPLKPQHCPYSPNPIKYGKDNHAPSPLDDSPLLNEAGKKRVQQIVGSFLYYARAVDPTIIMALSEISSQQSAPTENTTKRINQFLDYMWTHPDAIIRYRASDMIINVHSDASYLSAPKARSRAGGYFFLGS
jgi:hypothetical protein